MMTESDCWHYANEVCGDCGYPITACRCDPDGEEVGPDGERPATPAQRAAAAKLFDNLQPIEEL